MTIDQKALAAAGKAAFEAYKIMLDEVGFSVEQVGYAASNMRILAAAITAYEAHKAGAKDDGTIMSRWRASGWPGEAHKAGAVQRWAPGFDKNGDYCGMYPDPAGEWCEAPPAAQPEGE